MTWTNLDNISQVEQCIEDSVVSPQLLFKHSTRCSISTMVLRRAEDQIDQQFVNPLFLDLIQFRNISNYIAEVTGVFHESPQAILLKYKKVVYHGSHGSIDWQIINKLCKE